MQLSKLKNERGEAWTPSPGSPGGDIILYMLKYLHFRSFMSTGLPIHFFLLFLMKLSFVSKLRIWSQKSNSLGSNSCSFAYWLFDLGQIIYSPHTLVCSADSWSLWALNEWKLVNHLGLVLCRHSLTGLLPTHSARRVNEKKIPLPPRFLPFFTVLVWWHCSGDRMAPHFVAEAAHVVIMFPAWRALPHPSRAGESHLVTSLVIQSPLISTFLNGFRTCPV